MRVGLMAVVFGRVKGMGVMKAFATHAERLGFSTLWAPEHVVLVDQYQSHYPYSEQGKFPAPTDAPIADPFLTLCTLASVTERIRLGTAICLVPEHNPLVLAKVIATLDCLSEGRFTLGVGVGWLEEEFRALGISWERRAQRTRENIEALRRVAEYGNGWIGFNLTPDEAAAKIRRIEELLKASGRKRSEVELAASNSGKPITTDDLKRYRDAGVEEFVVTSLRAPHTPDEAQAVVEK